jgi:hypothetical protein
MDAHTNFDMAHSGPPDSSAPLSSLPLQSAHPVAPQDSYRLLESSEAPGQTAQVNLQEAVLPHAAAVSASNRSARDVRSYTMDADWKPQPDGRSYSITDVVEACVVALEHVNLDDGMSCRTHFVGFPDSSIVGPFFQAGIQARDPLSRSARGSRLWR